MQAGGCPPSSGWSCSSLKHLTWHLAGEQKVNLQPEPLLSHDPTSCLYVVCVLCLALASIKLVWDALGCACRYEPPFSLRRQQSLSPYLPSRVHPGTPCILPDVLYDNAQRFAPPVALHKAVRLTFGSASGMFALITVFDRPMRFGKCGEQTLRKVVNCRSKTSKMF